MIRLRLLPRGLEEAECFVALAMFVAEDYPFRGCLERLDRLLEGEASRLVEGGKLSGAWESQAMLASRGRLATEYVLFAGLGPLEELTHTTLYRQTQEIVERMMRVSARSLSVQTSGFAQPPGDFSTIAAEIMNGAIRGAAGIPRDVDILLCEPEEEKYGALIALGEQIVFGDAENCELSLEVLM